MEDPRLLELRSTVVEYLTSLLSASTGFDRGDYRELAELALIALGAQPPRGKRFSRPRAYHQARWMAKVSAGEIGGHIVYLSVQTLNAGHSSISQVPVKVVFGRLQSAKYDVS